MTSLGEAPNTNNPPESAQSGIAGATTHPIDPRYYYSDGSGVFIVDGVLFKVQATLIFGPRPVSSTLISGALSTMYIEDVLPMLSSSSNSNPIKIPEITATQFRDYLLILFGRPYDDDYVKLITSCRDSRYNKDLCIRYLNIATLAHCFGMIRLEEWAIDALHTIFARSVESLTEIGSEKWDSDTVLRLRASTKGTKADLLVLTFIQYLISVGSRDEAIHVRLGDPISDLLCVGLYHHLKVSNADPALFGCAFLNILSFGHRSPVWTTCVTRADRALLYVAQVQLVDASGGLDYDTSWMSAPDRVTSFGLCGGCRTQLSEVWNQSFGHCSRALGSGFPLKDALLLAQLPLYRHEVWELAPSITHDNCHDCPTRPELKSPMAVGIGCTRHPVCSIAPILGLIDTNIQQVYKKVASKYKEMMEEI